jgi:hypothetical protein
MNAISSISETKADAETAALYRDIKLTLQVPVVNLLWRHLATIDGSLGAIWRWIKPLYENETLASEAAQLRNIDGLPGIVPWSRATLRECGLHAEGEATVNAILVNYDRSNPLNLIAVMALLTKLNGVDSSLNTRAVRRGIEMQPSTVPLPPLIEEHAMIGEIARLARVLHNIGVPQQSTKIVAGVPRHLAHWPGYLSLVAKTLSPIEEEIGQCIARVQRDAQSRGYALGRALNYPGNIPSVQRVVDALTLFGSQELIANYIPKVRLLRSAMPR